MEISATDLRVPHFYVLIAAAGSGSRLGADMPKQYMDIQGKTLLRRTIEQFLTCPGLKGIKVIISPEHRDLYDKSVAGLDLPEPIHGGENRSSSINNGLQSFSNLNDKDKILIHDAARPFIAHNEIINLALSLQEYEAATLGVPVADTLRHADQNIGTIDRTDLWAIQTPQAFHYKVICEAHKNAKPDKIYTDDTMMASDIGADVAIIKGHRRNFKITTQDDLELAQDIVKGTEEMEMRTGNGFDVHAFDMDKASDHIRLCGVDIPHTHALKGHSDADVGLHALTDALFGAMADGDIGRHFPPSDPQWKGKDSAFFLDYAVKRLHERGGAITHLDLTLICEAPKIGPHNESMRKRIAEICELTIERVSVKATTTEKLGFTGRGEGIAAQTLATIRIPND